MTTTTAVDATAAELLHLHPNGIEIEENVRLDPRLNRDFLASIEEHGVLVPVLAVRVEGQDKPFVREGQRRIQAARQVGLAAVP
nr:ParB/Srx family N-terminal domain-containing protein [Actinomycetes bacterium]